MHWISLSTATGLNKSLIKADMPVCLCAYVHPILTGCLLFLCVFVTLLIEIEIFMMHKTVTSRNWSALPESVWSAEKCTLQTCGPRGLRTDQTQFRTLLLTSNECGWWLYVLVSSAWQLSVEDFAALFLAMIGPGWRVNCRWGRSPVTNWTPSPRLRPQLCAVARPGPSEASDDGPRPLQISGPGRRRFWAMASLILVLENNNGQWPEEAELKTETRDQMTQILKYIL